MFQPDDLKNDEPLLWSPGTGNDVWAIFVAARNGDLETIRQLLSKDPSLVRCRYEYRQPLGFAVLENKFEVCDYLLKKGANPTESGMSDGLLQICEDRGFTSIRDRLVESIAGSAEKLKMGNLIARLIKEQNLTELYSLLDKFPEAIDACDEKTNQPIHWAVMTRQIPIIKNLLERGADINARRLDGAKPLQLFNGDYHYRGWRDVAGERTTPEETLDFLLASGADYDITTAAYRGDLKRVEDILTLDRTLANRCSDYITYYPGSGSPLRNAAGAGHLEVVQMLLKAGADPNLPENGIAPRGYALYSAVYNRHAAIARLLLQAGAHPNTPVESSADTLTMAILHGDQSMVDLLCSYGATRSVELLAYYNDVKEAAAVFAANPSLARDVHAFEYAVSEGHEWFVRLLLKYVPDLAKQTSAGLGNRNPKEELEDTALAGLLFAQGMDPNQPNWLGVTPLHRFAKKGDIPNAALFIKQGAKINSMDEQFHTTPLGYAAKQGRMAMVKFLLGQGADPALPGDRPRATPLYWAQTRGYKGMVEVFKKIRGIGGERFPVSGLNDFRLRAYFMLRQELYP